MGAKFDKRILKYAKDLAFVASTSESTIQIALVPHLPVSISNMQRKMKKMPCLLHTLQLGDGDLPREVIPLDHNLDPAMWWHPNMRYNLQRIESGISQLIKPNHK